MGRKPPVRIQDQSDKLLVERLRRECELFKLTLEKSIQDRTGTVCVLTSFAALHVQLMEEMLRRFDTDQIMEP